MIDLKEKIFSIWKDNGIDTKKIIAEKYEVDPKRMLLSHGQILKFKFKIIDEYKQEFWKAILDNSMKIECTLGYLTLYASMNHNILLNSKNINTVFNNSDCFIMFKINIDNKYLSGEKFTEQELNELTKPEFLQKECGNNNQKTQKKEIQHIVETEEPKKVTKNNKNKKKSIKKEE